MAVEPRRGCGYRKIGGLYLVSGGQGVPCDRLPFPLDVCPTCHHGIKQSRGWTWIDVAELVGGVHPQCQDEFPCPICMAPADMGKAGLLWIGEQFYKTPLDFMREAAELGISRRISAIPRGFKVGETWVLFAHPKTIPCSNCSGTGLHGGQPLTPDPKIPKCGDCKGTGYKQGIFRVWRPERIEKILPESWKIDPAHFEELQDLADKGITPVFVPDNDPDHRAPRGRKSDEEENGEEAEATRIV